MSRLFDFCVKGPPISQQASGASKARWKAKVLVAAQAHWPAAKAAFTQPLSVRVTYYYEGAALDVDNMLKPILDSLVGLVYGDDAQVSDCNGRKRDINGSFRVRGLSPHLATAFSDGNEFLHIEILDPPDHQDLD